MKNLHVFIILFLVSALNAQDEKLIQVAKDIIVVEPVMKMKGQQLPKFEAKTLQDEFISSTQLSSKPTLLNIWFKECQPCLDEIPLLNKIYDEYNDEVNMYSLTFNTKEEVTDFLSKTEFKLNHIYGMGEYIDKLGVKYYPKTILLDRTNKIFKVFGKPYLSSCNQPDTGYLGCFDALSELINELL